MHAPKERLRLYVLLFIIGLPFAANAAEDPSAVGAVDRVENESKIVAGDAVTPAKIGTPVHLRDELRTGPEGRLKVTFRDDTLLTLGENASVVVDRYVYDPRQSVGQTVIQTTKGAFLFASGLHQRAKAALYCRLDAGRRYRRWYAVLGWTARQIWGARARGRNHGVQSGWKGDSLRRRPGHRHPSPLNPPGAGKPWSEEKIARAVATVALH
jgi:hypothetical protein